MLKKQELPRLSKPMLARGVSFHFATSSSEERDTHWYTSSCGTSSLLLLRPKVKELPRSRPIPPPQGLAAAFWNEVAEPCSPARRTPAESKRKTPSRVSYPRPIPRDSAQCPVPVRRRSAAALTRSVRPRFRTQPGSQATSRRQRCSRYNLVRCCLLPTTNGTYAISAQLQCVTFCRESACLEGGCRGACVGRDRSWKVVEGFFMRSLSS